MRIIESQTIISALSSLIDNCLKNVDAGAIDAIKRAKCEEDNPLAAWAADKIIQNAEIASGSDSYACQDTGQAVVFAEVGEDVAVHGLTDAINEGVRCGYNEARKSVADPLTRLNTKDNTPAVIHYDIVPGDKLILTYLAKGAGSENASRLYMLVPADGEDGIITAVTDCVKRHGFNACPPLFIGVGIGGTMEKAATLAKVALMREVNAKHPRKDVAELESKIAASVNACNIGIGAYGGKHTALNVAVEVAPTHIGMLPVAVCLNCHSVRHGKVEL